MLDNRVLKFYLKCRFTQAMHIQFIVLREKKGKSITTFFYPSHRRIIKAFNIADKTRINSQHADTSQCGKDKWTPRLPSRWACLWLCLAWPQNVATPDGLTTSLLP